MKKAVLKEIKRIASELPESYVIEYSRVKVNSDKYSVEQKRAMKMADDTMYTFNSKEERFVQINHVTKLKAAYKQNGDRGITEYVNWLNKHNMKMDRLATELTKQNKRKAEAAKITLKEEVVNGSRHVLRSFFDFLTSPYYAIRDIKWQR